jgi:hypothetical protein
MLVRLKDGDFKTINYIILLSFLDVHQTKYKKIANSTF